MEECLKGWKNRDEVYIPPVERKGFQENIIIRQKVTPEREERFMSMDEQDAPTVLVNTEMKKGDDEPTVLSTGKRDVHVYICRVKTGEEAEINENPFVVGKGSDCNFIICNNPTISRHHIRIEDMGEEYMLYDLQSSNHTYLEQKMISEPIVITDGMKVQLSNEEFQFRVEIG